MGSGSTRKQSDQVIITRQPRKGSGSEGGGQHEKDLQNLCPASLPPIKITEKLVTEGMKAVARKEGEIVAVYAGNQKVAELSKSRSKQIAECMENGFRYEGKVVQHKDDTFYAELFRAA